jgi:hypothetical protein
MEENLGELPPGGILYGETFLCEKLHWRGNFREIFIKCTRERFFMTLKRIRN